MGKGTKYGTVHTKLLTCLAGGSQGGRSKERRERIGETVRKLRSTLKLKIVSVCVHFFKGEEI